MRADRHSSKQVQQSVCSCRVHYDRDIYMYATCLLAQFTCMPAGAAPSGQVAVPDFTLPRGVPPLPTTVPGPAPLTQAGSCSSVPYCGVSAACLPVIAGVVTPGCTPSGFSPCKLVRLRRCHDCHAGWNSSWLQSSPSTKSHSVKSDSCRRDRRSQAGLPASSGCRAPSSWTTHAGSGCLLAGTRKHLLCSTAS